MREHIPVLLLALGLFIAGCASGPDQPQQPKPPEKPLAPLRPVQPARPKPPKLPPRAPVSENSAAVGIAPASA